MRRRFPGYIPADHVGDAADALDIQLHAGAIRHLNAAIVSLSRENLLRAGVSNDAPAGRHCSVDDTRRNHPVALGFADTARRHALLVRDLESDAPRDGSGRFAGGDYGAAQFATAATAAGAVELANRVLAQVAL